MTIIKFPGKKRSDGDDAELQRAVRLKQQLIEFTLEGPLREVFLEERQIAGMDDADEIGQIMFADWFIFNWEGENDENVLDSFVEADADIDPDDLAVLDGWFDSIEDVFEIVEIGEDAVVMKDHDGASYVTYPTSLKPKELGWNVGSVIDSRILPLGDRYVFSGIQRSYPNWETALIMRNSDTFISSILYGAFVEFFGANEVTLRSNEFLERMSAFQSFAFGTYRSPLLPKPLIEIVEAAGGHVPPMIEIEPDAEIAEEDEITILADPDAGIALVPDYPVLRRYLETGDGDEQELAELVYEMLEADHVLPFVFRRMAGISSQRLEHLLGIALNDPDFSVEDDLDELLDEFKPDDDEGEDALEGIDEEEEDLVGYDDLPDVRILPATERPSGSLAEAIHKFTKESTAKLKKASADDQALASSLFFYYATESGVSHPSQIDSEFLLDFLSVWYTRSWADRSVSGVKTLLTVMAKFTAWLDKHHGTTIGREFKADVLPHIKDQLPRTVKASDLMTDYLGVGALTVMMEMLAGPEEKSFSDFESWVDNNFNPDDKNDLLQGLFLITGIDGQNVALQFVDEEGEAGRSVSVETSIKAAKELRPGDFLEGSLVAKGKHWVIANLVGVFPPAGGAM